MESLVRTVSCNPLVILAGYLEHWLLIECIFLLIGGLGGRSFLLSVLPRVPFPCHDCKQQFFCNPSSFLLHSIASFIALQLYSMSKSLLNNLVDYYIYPILYPSPLWWPISSNCTDQACPSTSRRPKEAPRMQRMTRNRQSRSVDARVQDLRATKQSDRLLTSLRNTPQLYRHSTVAIRSSRRRCPSYARARSVLTSIS